MLVKWGINNARMCVVACDGLTMGENNQANSPYCQIRRFESAGRVSKTNNNHSIIPGVYAITDR